MKCDECNKMAEDVKTNPYHAKKTVQVIHVPTVIDLSCD